MSLIGVRELREKTTEVLRRVREEKAEYVVTNQGRPVALLLPVDADAVEKAMLQAGKQSSGASWDAYRRLADELRRAWPAGQATQTIVNDLRGE
jgi:prevent-host-death family protein